MSGGRRPAGVGARRRPSVTAHHERFTATGDVRLPSDRAVGLVFASAGAAVGLAPLLGGRPPRAWALLVAAGFLVLALLRPGVLGPLNRAWMRLAAVLNRVTTLVALAIVFFGILTPTAVLLRLLGKDVLRLRLEPHASSYWLDRVPPGPPPGAMANQF